MGLEEKPTSKNTNCLEGVRCPSCGHDDEVLVYASMWVSDLAQRVVDMLEEREEDQDFPGVFDYEVSEPLGAWIGDAMANPESQTIYHLDACLERTKELIDKFFTVAR